MSKMTGSNLTCCQTHDQHTKKRLFFANIQWLELDATVDELRGQIAKIGLLIPNVKASETSHMISLN